MNKKAPPMVSMIVVSYNTQRILAQCLTSLEKGLGSLKNQAELIVIDNGSTDETPLFLGNYQKKTQAFKVRVIFNPENQGFGRAVNQAVKVAAGEWLLLLNSDIVCRPEAIEKLVGWAKLQPRVGAVGGRLLNLDGTPQPSVFHLPTVRAAVAEFWFGRKGAFSKYLPAASGEAEAVAGAVMLIPAGVISQKSLFDERYFMYFEDLDLCRRLGRSGLKTYYCAEACFYHHHGASGKSASGFVSRRLVESSKIYHGAAKKWLIDGVIVTGRLCQKIKKLIGR